MRWLVTILALTPLAGCAGSQQRNPRMLHESDPSSTVRTLDIELLALDLTTCGRCTGTDRTLTEAIETVASLLEETGTRVRVTKHVVRSAEQAEQLRFSASPTIRVDGRDIAIEFRESSCKDCGDLCGCEGGVDCRVWVWEGREHLEAPTAMIVDAVLRARYADSPPPDRKPYTMPQNLRRFFAAQAQSTAAASGTEECCDREACCGSTASSQGCGSIAAGAAAATPGKEPCGCR